jgi:hypothetical protein
MNQPSMMHQIEKAILQTLRELDERVKTLATASPKPDLRPLFQRLDELTQDLPPDADGELRHFLSRKSYAKARAHLEGRAPERGACGR